MPSKAAFDNNKLVQFSGRNWTVLWNGDILANTVLYFLSDKVNFCSQIIIWICMYKHVHRSSMKIITTHILKSTKLWYQHSFNNIVPRNIPCGTTQKHIYHQPLCHLNYTITQSKHTKVQRLRSYRATFSNTSSKRH